MLAYGDQEEQSPKEFAEGTVRDPGFIAVSLEACQRRSAASLSRLHRSAGSWAEPESWVLL